MSGITGLRKIQIGEESGKGTAVAATAVLLGLMGMKSSPTIHRPREERAQMAENSRSVLVSNLAELTYEGDVTYEQLIYLLHMGILGNVTPSTVDTSARLWTFTPAMTAAGVYDSFTIEAGDDTQAWEAEYCMARQIVISGAMNEVLRVRADIFGRKMSTASFTGSLTPPTVESIPTQECKLYIDAESGTMGFTYTINTGLSPKRHGDGSQDFTAYNENFKSAELRLTAAFNAAAEAQRVLFDGSTQRLIRIKAEGSLAGAATALRTLILDISGVYTNVDRLGEREGEDIMEFTFSSERGANYTKLFEVAVQNAVTTLP
jgi:hypothetical protein